MIKIGLTPYTDASLACSKSRSNALQMPERRPKKFFRHLRISNFVGMRKVITTRNRRSANRRKRTRMQFQGVTDIVESNAMSQLRIQQRNHMTPRTEASSTIFNARLFRQLGCKITRNHVANLFQNGEFRSCWIDCFSFFHPNLVAGLRLSIQHFFQIPVGCL